MMNDIPQNCPRCWSTSAWKIIGGTAEIKYCTEPESPELSVSKITYCCQRCGYTGKYAAASKNKP